MKAGDEFIAEDGCGALLLCARCKHPVKSGEQHQCNQGDQKDEKANEQKGNWSTGTKFPL